jgi:hypothetical protein
MGVNGIFVKQFFPKKIVEKNSAMALFQSIYGMLSAWHGCLHLH